MRWQFSGHDQSSNLLRLLASWWMGQSWLYTPLYPNQPSFLGVILGVIRLASRFLGTSGVPFLPLLVLVAFLSLYLFLPSACLTPVCSILSNSICPWGKVLKMYSSCVPGCCEELGLGAKGVTRHRKNTGLEMKIVSWLCWVHGKRPLESHQWLQRW